MLTEWSLSWARELSHYPHRGTSWQPQKGCTGESDALNFELTLPREHQSTSQLYSLINLCLFPSIPLPLPLQAQLSRGQKQLSVGKEEGCQVEQGRQKKLIIFFLLSQSWLPIRPDLREKGRSESNENNFWQLDFFGKPTNGTHLIFKF